MSAPRTADLADHLVKTANADPASASLLASLVSDRLRWADNGSAPVVLDGQGRPAISAAGLPVTPAALIAGFAAELPHLFVRPEAPAPAAPELNPDGTVNQTERALAEHKAAQQHRAGQSGAEHGNPFRKGPSWNLTRQVLMKSRDPATAARLEVEARA